LRTPTKAKVRKRKPKPRAVSKILSRPFLKLSLFPLDFIMSKPPLQKFQVAKIIAMTTMRMTKVRIILMPVVSSPPVGTGKPESMGVPFMPGRDNESFILSGKFRNFQNIYSDYFQYNKRKNNKQKADNGRS
jgi:hypothetical protein